jgi:tight adherence protein C
MLNFAELLNDPTTFIIIIGFLVIFLFCFGVLQFRQQLITKKEIISRISDDRSFSVDKHLDGHISENTKSNLKNRIFYFFENLGNRFKLNHSQDSAIKRIRFLRAGIRNPKAGLIFWGTKCFIAILFFGTFLVLRALVFTVINSQLTLFLCAFIPFFGFYLPEIWLRQKTDKRKEKLLKSLPDALDLMVVCVEAGMGLDEAINRVAKESNLQSPELSEELKFVGLELRAGKRRQDALKNLAERTNLEEVRNLVTLLTQADNFGTSIAHTLRVYSDAFRTERFQKAEEKAGKLPVKLMFPLIMFIFPALFVVIIGPGAISIYRNLILGS